MCDFKDARPCHVPSGRLCGTDSFEHPLVTRKKDLNLFIPPVPAFCQFLLSFSHLGLSLTYFKLSFLWALGCEGSGP